MDIPLPSSLSDVITDGILAQSSVDRAFSASLGKIDGVEFSIAEESTQAQVRINRAAKSSFDTSGSVVAWIDGDDFTWVSDRGEAFAIPELHGTHAVSDDLITAARTLHGNAPAFIAPFEDRGRALVIINEIPELGDTRTDLMHGLPRLNPDSDIVRALSAYAAVRGLGIRASQDRIALSDGTSLTLRNGQPFDISGGLSLRDVRADAAFSSAEHQLLFDALVPGHQATYNPQAGTALIDGQFEVSALPLAIIENNHWHWAWADGRVPGHTVEGIRRFGLDNGLLPLITPVIAVEMAQSLGLIAVAKPILQRWTHVVVDSGAGFKIVLLLDHPRLHLPPASHAAVEATLYSPISEELDARRAVAAYAAQRQIPFDGTAITVDNRQIMIEFTGDHISAIR